jgi:hypothetical protein
MTTNKPNRKAAPVEAEPTPDLVVLDDTNTPATRDTSLPAAERMVAETDLPEGQKPVSATGHVHKLDKNDNLYSRCAACGDMVERA